jgi:5-oxopent-3-ene-1,2,5-tricarboxylate decarboxylase / 2-hydroxyhepta-2,4-diene-1,7-dioate isomerase
VTFRSMGTVYGVLMNFHSEWEAIGAKMNEPPYKAPPKAPVLYIKPANTWSEPAAQISVPARIAEVEIGATIGMVMKGPREVMGYVLMNDLSVPHASYFRPPVKFKCLDGFLGVGGEMLPASDATDPSRFTIDVRINGALKQTVKFDALVRNPHQLVADVSEFMTLGAGDVLMLGCEAARPRAKAGDVIELSAEGIGTLSSTLIAEGAP